MPKKTQPPELNWTKFLEATAWQQEMQAVIEALRTLTGRQLYDAEMVCQMPQLLINRPVNKAMHRTIINFPVEPVDIMRDCLIDGSVFLRVGDGEHIAVETHVTNATFDIYTDELVFVEIKYIHEINKKDYWYIEHWYKNSDGTGHQIVYQPTTQDQYPESWKVAFELDYPLFPYVGIRWINSQSFLDTLKPAVIRLEAALRVIGVENVERMGLALYLEGVRSVDDIKTAPRRMGRRVHILPPDAQFHSPNPDAPGMELMVKEINILQHAIEGASGVVTTERLASLSGVSRMIAEEPLIILAEEIRDRFTDGMILVADLVKVMQPGAEKLKISYRPLRHVADKEKRLTLLDKAHDEEAIDDSEYSRELRALLDLPPQE